MKITRLGIAVMALIAIAIAARFAGNLQASQQSPATPATISAPH